MVLATTGCVQFNSANTKDRAYWAPYRSPYEQVFQQPDETITRYIFALVSLYTSSPACKQARWLEREFSMVLQKMLASHHRVCSISCNTQLAFTSRSWLKWTINGLFRHVNYSSNLLSPNHPPLWTRISERMSCEDSTIFYRKFCIYAPY